SPASRRFRLVSATVARTQPLRAPSRNRRWVWSSLSRHNNFGTRGARSAGGVIFSRGEVNGSSSDTRNTKKGGIEVVRRDSEVHPRHTHHGNRILCREPRPGNRRLSWTRIRNQPDGFPAGRCAGR